ncbi:MAG TPA: site-2 protease family protein, partial [Thermoanaerobaculia bacterium]|nr:site-2 protease family protein [Thermoanaerobaculia bacterium]
VWTRQRGTVEYSLRLIPLGGFVTPATEEHEFRSIPLRKRIAFFIGGPLANVVATLPLFAFLNVSQRGLSLREALIAPPVQAAQAFWQFVTAIPGLFSHPELLSGPIRIVVEGSRAAEAGMALELAIALSISLAVMNLLPLPVLDGGQIVMSCLEERFPRMIDLRAPLTLVGVLLLASAMVYVNVRDVFSLFA